MPALLSFIPDGPWYLPRFLQHSHSCVQYLKASNINFHVAAYATTYHVVQQHMWCSNVQLLRQDLPKG